MSCALYELVEMHKFYEFYMSCVIPPLKSKSFLPKIRVYIFENLRLNKESGEMVLLDLLDLHDLHDLLDLHDLHDLLDLLGLFAPPVPSQSFPREMGSSHRVILLIFKILVEIMKENINSLLHLHDMEILHLQNVQRK